MDVFIIKIDRCFLRRQNCDYVVYLLIVLYYEFWKIEEWEKSKIEVDMEEYIWENSLLERNILEMFFQMKVVEKNMEINKEEFFGIKEVEEYKKFVVSFKNEEENENLFFQYKEFVKRLLNVI